MFWRPRGVRDGGSVVEAVDGQVVVALVHAVVFELLYVVGVVQGLFVLFRFEQVRVVLH